MSWEQLQEILEDQQKEHSHERVRRPSACPNDGTPLEADDDGKLICPFDQWRWPDDSVPASAQS